MCIRDRGNPGVILRKGLVVGIWTAKTRQRSLGLSLQLWETFTPGQRQALQTQGEAYAAFRGLTLKECKMEYLVPVSYTHLANGAGLFSAIIVLSVMILPNIISVSVTALNAVPPEYEEASLALGATATETYFKVSVPAAKSGIAAGVVLGIGRAIGEAMAVMMVAGNVANMPSLFQSVTFLTTAVAKEMGYASGLQRERCV